MFRKPKTQPRIITSDEEDLIIWNYLNRITPAYKDQDMPIETMIQIEKSVIAARTTEPSIVAAVSVPK